MLRLGFGAHSAGCERLGVVSGVELDYGVAEETAKVRKDSAEGHVLEELIYDGVVHLEKDKEDLASDVPY